MKLIIWGIGKIFIKYKRFLKTKDIVVFVDNCEELWGKSIDGIKVISPSKINKYTFDYIVIMTKSYNEIRKQIKELGIDQNKIVDEKHLLGLKDKPAMIRYDAKRPNSHGKKIIIFSHSLDRTGAPLVLYNMAKILVEEKYDVEVYSLLDDQLLDDYISIGIPVTLFSHFEMNEKILKRLVDNFDLIIVNTLVLYKIVDKLKDKTVIWWLHEEDDIFNKMIKSGMQITSRENLHIYGVSNRTIASMKKFFPHVHINKLQYGIFEYKKILNDNYKQKQKIIYAIIGTVCLRKGHDILSNVIKINKENWKEKAEFWVIGGNTLENVFFKNCDELIKIWGEISHDKLIELYSDIDVVLCPSRNDPLPVVMAEGMQYKKVCIASDMTGTAEIIKPYVNGLVCKSGDEKSLQECIQWTLNNRAKFFEIGEKAYMTYKEQFSLEIFKSNIMEIILKTIGN